MTKDDKLFVVSTLTFHIKRSLTAKELGMLSRSVENKYDAELIGRASRKMHFCPRDTAIHWLLRLLPKELIYRENRQRISKAMERLK